VDKLLEHLKEAIFKPDPERIARYNDLILPPLKFLDEHLNTDAMNETLQKVGADITDQLEHEVHDIVRGAFLGLSGYGIGTQFDHNVSSVYSMLSRVKGRSAGSLLDDAFAEQLGGIRWDDIMKKALEEVLKELKKRSV